MYLLIPMFMGTIGFGYFIYGKKMQDFIYLFIGIALMAYPYFIKNMIISLILGIVLIFMPYILKKF